MTDREEGNRGHPCNYDTIAIHASSILMHYACSRPIMVHGFVKTSSVLKNYKVLFYMSHL